MKSVIALALALLVSPGAMALDWQTALGGAHRDEAKKAAMLPVTPARPWSFSASVRA